MGIEGVDIRTAKLGKEGAQVHGAEALEAFRSSTTLTWTHVVAYDVEAARGLLEDTFGFHELEVEDALSPDERPELRVGEDSVFLVLPAPVSTSEDRPSFVEVALFWRQATIVTVVREPLALLDAWFNRCTARSRAGGGSSALLAHGIIDAIVDEYFPYVDALSEEVDVLEDVIYKGAAINVAEALQLKRRLLEVRRQAMPVRGIINGLLRRDLPNMTKEAEPYFQDVYDHTLRIAEMVDMERDILASLLDSHLSIVSNNLNQVMRTLTVISTALMSGALIAGIYGMNFKFMPELDWKYGYPFAWLLIVLAVAAEVWYFRKRGWL